MRVSREEREHRQHKIEEAQAKLADLPGHSRITDPQLLDRKKAFIEAAPDGAAAKTGKRANGRVYKARKVPVSFTVEQELLTAFDARAAELGLSRAAAMALAMSRLVRGELIVRGDQ